jgi:hypothetical protein
MAVFTADSNTCPQYFAAEKYQETFFEKYPESGSVVKA